MEQSRLFRIALVIFLISGISKSATALPFSQKVDSIQIVFDNQQLILPGESF